MPRLRLLREELSARPGNGNSTSLAHSRTRRAGTRSSRADTILSALRYTNLRTTEVAVNDIASRSPYALGLRA